MCISAGLKFKLLEGLNIDLKYQTEGTYDKNRTIYSNMCIKRLVLNVVNLIISIIVYKTIYAIFGYSLMTAY